MKKKLAQNLLRLFGWKVSEVSKEALQKCIIIVAPHTSNWDFMYAILYAWAIELNVNYLIKDTYLKNPFSRWFVKSTGGIGVKKNKSNNLVSSLTEAYETNEKIAIALSPEGTRKRVDHWKPGFYYIAQEAKIPIILGFIDYGSKTVGLSDVLPYDISKDKLLQKLNDYFTQFEGRNPTDFNPKIVL